MEKETSLSEKIRRNSFIYVLDVREAVLRLKKKFNDAHFDKGIEEIFGEKLT